MNRRASPQNELLPVALPEGDGKALGQHLIDMGLIDEEDIVGITEAQLKNGRRFGDAAVKLGLVTRRDVDDAVSRQFNFPSPQRGALSAELVVATTPQRPVAEAMRSLRTELALHWINKLQTQCLSIVSAERGEGRSFVAANLAVAFAQMNERTLLIDMDLRHPRQHEIFRVSNRYGLTSLVGGRGRGQEIQRVEGYETLYVLPAGQVPPSPQELLSARSLSPLLDQLRAEFDIILVDTPAWSCGADAQIVSAQTGQALLVSAPRRATRVSTDRLLAALRQVGVSVAGAAVNKR